MRGNNWRFNGPDLYQQELDKIQYYQAQRVETERRWRQQSDALLNKINEKEATPMSAVLWCDMDDQETNAMPGIPGHSFPEKDPERRHYSDTHKVSVRTGDSYGRETYQDRQMVTDELDICGYHMRKQSMFQTGNETPKTITSKTDKDSV
jgi:hypothetical protein